ncbi:MAG: PLP-dependent aminotransferase family protein [Muricoprocola sp.]
MNELTISLDGNSAKPLYEQIYEYLKTEIQSGGLPCGVRLPSTRKLSQYLEVSRSTVNLAYEQLLSEGYIENRPCRGFFVNNVTGLYQIRQETKEKSVCQEQKERPYLFDFSPSGVELEKFPDKTWTRLYRGILSEQAENLLQIGNPQGDVELREALCSYLFQARGVRCKSDQIVVGAGNDFLLMLLSLLLKEKVGNKEISCAMEEITYKKAYDIFKMLGITMHPVAMDFCGMDIHDLEKKDADLAYVMPSHQYPLGTVMPLTRRMELLNWASLREGRYLIEDDYDSEFRYKGKPIPALQGYDTRGKVIYIGSFSKSIASAIRISFMILPDSLLEVYNKIGKRISNTVSRVDQKVLKEFLTQGYYERHLNRMRGVYRGKRNCLLEQMKKLKGICSVTGEDAGTHILVRMENGMTDDEAAKQAEEYGVKVYTLKNWCIREIGCNRKLVLGYATMKEEDIIQAVDRLVQAWS